jgi:Zn-dependent protease
MFAGGSFSDRLTHLPEFALMVIIAFAIHELAHAVVATMFGDPTPRQNGRLTLNPIRHLDKWGTGIMVFSYLFFGFLMGWAWTPLRPNMMKHRRLGVICVALAGPAANFVLAVGAYSLLLGLGVTRDEVHFVVEGGPMQPHGMLVNTVFIGLSINLVLSVFNLIPIPPLDGSRVVGALLPPDMARDWARLDEYAPMVFLAAMLLFSQQLGSLIGTMEAHALTVMDHVVR